MTGGQACLFDVYGTLLRFTDDGPSPYSVLLSDSGLEPAQCRRLARKFLTCRLRDMEAAAALIRQEFPEACVSQELLRRARARLTEQLAGVALCRGARRTLGWLRQREVRLALVSNLASPYTDPIHDLGLEALVDATIYSCEHGVIKPDPAIFEAALAALGAAAADTIMVGDNAYDDVEGAERAGLRAVLLDPGEARGPGVIHELLELSAATGR